jgi:CubicO group peptidase (beta-lactamase class C family)
MRTGDDTSVVQARGIEASGTHINDVRSAAQLRVRNAYAGKLMPTDLVDLFKTHEWTFAQRTIACGSNPYPLPSASSKLEDVAITSHGKQFDLADYVSRNRVAGLLIIKDGKVLREHYDLGMDQQTRWPSMSVAKSISTTLVGAAIRDGAIRSVDDLLTHYLPALHGTPYAQVTIRHLLQMATGLSWDEDQTDAHSHRRSMLELQLDQKPGAITRYLASRDRIAPSGDRWEYSTGEVHIVGELLRATTGKWLCDYLSEKIWSKFSMESPAQWWLETPGGLEIAGTGLDATLRDFGRFGLFFLGGGIAGGRPVLPEGWLPEATLSRRMGSKQVDYGYMWWPVAAPDGTFADGAFSARGIFGQYIYINPVHQLIVVSLSARSKPRFAEGGILDNDFFNGVVQAVR